MNVTALAAEVENLAAQYCAALSIGGVRLLDGDELLGFVELESILWPHRHTWLSIAIGDAANQGQGYGSEAVAAISVPGVDRQTTASIGIATLPEHAADGEQLIRSADRALYAAKANGRNRIEIAQSLRDETTVNR